MNSKKLPFTEFYKQARQKVLPWITYKARSIEAGKDIFHDVITEMHETYEKIQNPLAYAFVVAKRRIYNEHKALKNRNGSHIPYEEIDITDLKNVVGSDRYDYKDLANLIKDLVHKTLDKLPEFERDVLTQEIFGQQSIDEICEFNKIAPRKYFRIKENFRLLFAKIYNEEY